MDIQELTNDSYKFYNCRHRSEEEREVIIKRCSCQGGNYTDKGWFCNKRNIFKINTTTCAECQEYEPKE
jgi:hypothetical protein